MFSQNKSSITARPFSGQPEQPGNDARGAGISHFFSTRKKSGIKFTTKHNKQKRETPNLLPKLNASKKYLN